MLLDSVFIRFFKAFNYDYTRKNSSVNRRPWEMIGDQFYPFVEVSLDPSITCIVGANESGKSHLLSAIEKGLQIVPDSPRGGQVVQHREIERQDFCRYSDFFTSTQDSQTYPDIGFKWSHLSEKNGDVARLLEVWPDAPNLGEAPIYYFRFNRDQHVLFAGSNDARFDIPSDKLSALQKWLPRVFRIESDIALPDSISIARLIEGRYDDNDKWGDTGRRLAAQLVSISSPLQKLFREITTVPVPAANNQPNFPFPRSLHQQLVDLEPQLKTQDDSVREEERRRKIAEFNLAYDLIFEIARIKQEDIELLQEALKNGRTGIVRTVVDNINKALERRLDFARVWAQDRDFALQIEATDYEINFLISDRTGCHYSFDERSSGLKHFLSYYIQYLRYNPERDSPAHYNEVLMMDEPDAFLSGEAQQDLLKVFEMFVDPESPKRRGRGPLQVIYVTHSPFLIDKNHSERVRALEKGEGWRGTRIIKGEARNHYEPLRSAFGTFIGETTFISGCNLITEGQADQILLVGASSHLRRQKDVPETETLDLNRLTIVPSGGASTVPYFVYLARGRDGDKPAVVVLLDSDKSGNEAKDKIVTKRGEHPGKKRLLSPDLVVQIGEITCEDAPLSDTENTPTKNSLVELEDLVPAPIAVLAAKRFLQVVFGWADEELGDITLGKVEAQMANGSTNAFLAVNSLIRVALSGDESQASDAPATQEDDDECIFGKVAFARTIAELLPELDAKRAREDKSADASAEAERAAIVNALDQFEATMRNLFRVLREKQAEAERRHGERQMRQRVEHRVQIFVGDYKERGEALRYIGQKFLEDIERELVGGDEDEIAFIRQTIVTLREHFKLRQNPVAPIDDFSVFLAGVESLRDARERVDAHLAPNAFLSSSTQSAEAHITEPPEIESKANRPKSTKTPRLATAEANASDPDLMSPGTPG